MSSLAKKMPEYSDERKTGYLTDYMIDVPGTNITEVTGPLADLLDERIAEADAGLFVDQTIEEIFEEAFVDIRAGRLR